MEKEFKDTKQIQANKQALGHLVKKTTALIPFWEKLLPGKELTTEHIHNWIGEPDYIFEVYRQEQLDGGMTAVVFDSLPEQTKRPPLDQPIIPPNPLQPTRHGPGVTQHRSMGTGRPPRSYALTHQGVRVLDYMKAENKIFIDKTWLEVHRGEVRAVKDSDRRIEAKCTHRYTKEQIALAEQLGGVLETFKRVHDACNGNLPIATDKDGRITGLDFKKLTSL